MWWLISRLFFVCVIATIDLPKLSPTATGLVKSSMMVSLALLQRAYDAVMRGTQPATHAKVIVVPEENMWWILFRVLGHIELGRAATVRVVMPARLCHQNMLSVLVTSFLFVQCNLEPPIPEGAVVVACSETEPLLTALTATEAFVTIDPLDASALIIGERQQAEDCD